MNGDKAAGGALEADDGRRQMPEAGAPGLDDTKTARDVDAAAKLSPAPKPHGDTLGVAAEAASPDPTPGDSPKRQGDPLERAVGGKPG